MSIRLPDFLIIGAQRSGTTSLYTYLTQHPQIVPAQQKELHYFDLQFERGPQWYSEQFQEIDASTAQITGEASPYYLFHPCVPARVHALMPHVRLIVLLRDPVQRAISHHTHETQLGYETLPLAAALDAESERLAGAIEQLLNNPYAHHSSHEHHSYVARGCYAEQVQRWLHYFPREQFCILRTEDLAQQPQQVMTIVCSFLGLPDHPFQLGEWHNQRPLQVPDAATRAWLQAIFTAPNQDLKQLLGSAFVWPAPPHHPEPTSQTLIVTGMHRSGTSLLASLMAHGGLAIGEQFIPASPHNPRGYFEDQDFMALQEAMIHDRNMPTMAPRSFSYTPSTSELTQAHALIAARNHQQLWGWKDPRTCLFLDLWNTLLPTAAYLFVYRHPIDVLLSLMRRHEPFMAGLIEGLEAWYTYNTRMLTFLQAHPDRCVLGHISAMMRAPELLSDLMQTRLGIPISISTSDIATIYHPAELRTYRLTSAQLAELSCILPEAIALYQQLEHQADLPEFLAVQLPLQANPPPPTVLSMLERRVRLISLCAQIDPEITEQFYAQSDQEICLLKQGVQDAHASAIQMERVAAAAWAAHAEAERYARSLKQALQEAERYAQSLEHAFREAERYAQSLEAELQHLRQAAVPHVAEAHDRGRK